MNTPDNSDFGRFEELVLACRPQLVRCLGRLVGDSDAEDVVQIALAKAADALSTFRGEASQRSWLFRIATNAGHDWNRTRRAHSAVPLPTEDEDVIDDGAVDPVQERQLVREQMSQCVGDILRQLPEHYQAALALGDCDELSDRELADVLGLTLGAAKIRLHRARARLKRELERECSFYRDGDNVLCCDKKQLVGEEAVGDEKHAAQKNSPSGAYLSGSELRHQVDSRAISGDSENLQQEPIMAIETLPTKEKHIIGIGAAIAAGCQPCTSAYVAAARAAGACPRGVRLSLEAGLRMRETAAATMAQFADQSFDKPDLDAGFRAEKVNLEALIHVAAAVAGNAATLVKAQVKAARKLGMTDQQIRMAAQIAATVRQAAEKETEAALAEVLGDAIPTGCGCGSPTEKAAPACGCRG